MKIEIIEGNIEEQDVDAIVNAAHEGLCGGGGVDGAIHRAAGPSMTGECMNLYGCPTGECRITGGYNLPAKYIIHTVGPVWRGGMKDSEKNKLEAYMLLKECYYNCLKMANMQGLKTIAFPCISTGAYCFPKKDAAKIALSAVKDFFHNYTSFFATVGPWTGSGSKVYIETVKFICYENEDFVYYFELFGKQTSIELSREATEATIGAEYGR